jgi:hypothetical protein
MSKFDYDLSTNHGKKIAHRMKKLLAFVFFLIGIRDIHVVIDIIKLQTHEVAIM